MVESKAFSKNLRANDTPSLACVCHNTNVTRGLTTLSFCAILALQSTAYGAAPSADAGRSALDRADLKELVESVSYEHGVDPKLVDALVRVESSYDPNAVSRRGAMGLMQLMPATAKRLRVSDPFDPEENVRGGVKEFARLLEQYSGNLQFALAAYNAGEGAVARHGGVPPYAETRDYVSRILSIYTGRPYRMGDSYRPARPVKMVRDRNGAPVITNMTESATESMRPPALDGGPLRGGFTSK